MTARTHVPTPGSPGSVSIRVLSLKTLQRPWRLEPDRRGGRIFWSCSSPPPRSGPGRRPTGKALKLLTQPQLLSIDEIVTGLQLGTRRNKTVRRSEPSPSARRCECGVFGRVGDDGDDGDDDFEIGHALRTETNLLPACAGRLEAISTPAKRRLPAIRRSELLRHVSCFRPPAGAPIAFAGDSVKAN